MLPTERHGRVEMLASALGRRADSPAEQDASCPDGGRRARVPQPKTDSGRKAETIQLGASTISLMRRSTATLERM
jgi:hypothetical protein